MGRGHDRCLGSRSRNLRGKVISVCLPSRQMLGKRCDRTCGLARGEAICQRLRHYAACTSRSQEIMRGNSAMQQVESWNKFSSFLDTYRCRRPNAILAANKEFEEPSTTASGLSRNPKGSSERLGSCTANWAPKPGVLPLSSRVAMKPRFRTQASARLLRNFASEVNLCVSGMSAPL